MGMGETSMTSCQLHAAYGEKYEKELTNFKGKLKSWLDNYKGDNPEIIPVPRSQIETLLNDKA